MTETVRPQNLNYLPSDPLWKMLADPQLKPSCGSPESLLWGWRYTGFNLGPQNWSMELKMKVRLLVCRGQQLALDTAGQQCVLDQSSSRCPDLRILVLSPYSISCLSHCCSAPLPGIDIFFWTSCLLVPVCDCREVLSLAFVLHEALGHPLMDLVLCSSMVPGVLMVCYCDHPQNAEMQVVGVFFPKNALCKKSL